MTDKAEVIRLNGLTVTVCDDGDGPQPWNRDAIAYRYKVYVTDGTTTYTCPAWGSQHDAERGHRDPRGIGFMVAGELLSAYYDPEEFWDMAAPSNRTEALQIIALTDAATAMGEALELNADAIGEDR